VIPVRDRAGTRVENALVSLGWQERVRPAEIIVTSHGSRPEIDAELERSCERHGARLLRIGSASEPWCKPLALNSAIRATRPEHDYLMTMDADMILAPNFLTVALETLGRAPRSLVLCRSLDLPQSARVPPTVSELRDAYARLCRTARPRGRHGTGGIQLAERRFFFDVRGYDEELVWWGAEDGDMVARARRAGLPVVWLDGRTSMLHQWHPKRHAALVDPKRRAEASAAWMRNHALVRSKRTVQRNPERWGGAP
jgi:cellulose synthase/poly-beta-1,6-N-acetylglucosamine synthase-like glycosyltransferase